jgi:gamma-glutamyltranspeptidase
MMKAIPIPRVFSRRQLFARGGRPVLAVGGRGGRKIPDSVLEFLLRAMR